MKTKIIATLGPASEDEKIILKLRQKGASIFRLNLSHGQKTWHENIIKIIRKYTDASIMLDTKGPEIRTGEISEVKLKKGDTALIIPSGKPDHPQFKNSFKVTYQQITQVLNLGSIIAIDAGRVLLKTEKITKQGVFAQVVQGGLVTSGRHVNLPGTKIDLPILTKKDQEMLSLVKKYQIEYLAVSFVRNKTDLQVLKQQLQDQEIKHTQIISKIENAAALKNITAILDNSDAIMVARGDLGVETPWYQVPIQEEQLIKNAHLKNKPVIVATQMLSSMLQNSIPSRADVMDIAIAVQMGAQMTMLSDETAAGKFPVEAVQAMKQVVEYAEKNKF